MKCQNCGKEFHSFEWYSILDQQDIILCKKCVIEILQARISNYKSKIEHIEKQLEGLT
jgi:DNA-directed RNA polymerase subunit RPC12/RpoP